MICRCFPQKPVTFSSFKLADFVCDLIGGILYSISSNFKLGLMTIKILLLNLIFDTIGFDLYANS